MTISKEITHLEHSAVKMTVTIGKDDIRSEYDALLADYGKSIQIPGFRKGKVPREVLIRKFGDALRGEALGRIMEKAAEEIFKDESLPKEDRPLPYVRPSIEDEPKELNIDTDLVFSLVYDILPQVTVGKRKDLEVEVPDAEVTEEDIARELEIIRERNAIVLDRDDEAPAARDDVVTLNYAELSDSGEPLAGSERRDFAFTLGSGYNPYKFDDDIAGMKRGETRDIEKTYADDFADAELAGKTKKIRVTLTALKEKQLPDLDDDLAQDVDEKYNTLEDLKAAVRDQLTQNLERRLRDIKISNLLEKIMETTPVDIPESMVTLELNARWRNLARQIGVDPEEFTKQMEASGRGQEPLFAEWRPGAVKALQSRLIVETLIRDSAFTVSEEDLEKEMETVAGESKTTLEEVKKYYEAENMRELLADDIKERRLFDLLLSENTIKKGKPAKYLDLVPNNG
ncbi:MAG: trigger factor [Spirochaetaceae bacterium]|nr:trigger factor [Spirochaetaceae bacterium]